jgi:hypothetical protein
MREMIALTRVYTLKADMKIILIRIQTIEMAPRPEGIVRFQEGMTT